MCFRLQTVVWKFLWRDWTFHWRVAERAGASQTALCESQLPPLAGNLQGGNGGPTPLQQHSHEEFCEALSAQTWETSQTRWTSV